MEYVVKVFSKIGLCCVEIMAYEDIGFSDDQVKGALEPVMNFGRNMLDFGHEEKRIPE